MTDEKSCTEDYRTCIVHRLQKRAVAEYSDARKDLMEAGGPDPEREAPNPRDEDIGHLALAAIKKQHVSTWLAAKCFCHEPAAVRNSP